MSILSHPEGRLLVYKLLLAELDFYTGFSFFQCDRIYGSKAAAAVNPLNACRLEVG
jgi:hypothetical protein